MCTKICDGAGAEICDGAPTCSSVQVYFPRTIKATVMILGICLHLGMTPQTTVSIFDLDLHFIVH